MKTWRGLLFLGLFLGLPACVRVLTPVAAEVSQDTPDAGPCESPQRTDEFVLSGSTKLDFLVVVDDGNSADLMKQLPERLLPLFGALAGINGTSPTDFHLAVATTSGRGQLMQLFPQNSPDCPGCRYLARAQCTSDCSNVGTVGVTALTALGEKGVVAGETQGHLVETALAALGVVTFDGELTPHVDPPAANTGFYRPEAGLGLMFISAGTDPFLRDAGNHARTLRTLRNLKGPGGEDSVVVVTLTGVTPLAAGAFYQTVKNGCGITGSVPGAEETAGLAGFCTNVKALLLECQSTRAAFSDRCAGGSLREVASDNGNAAAGGFTLLAGNAGCVGAGGAVNAELDGPLLQFTCDMDGVVYNACADDWTNLLAGRFSRWLNQTPVLTLQQVPSVSTVSRAGCPRGTGAVCVEVQAPDGRVSLLDQGAVDTSGARAVLTLPRMQPGSRILVSYPVAPGTTQCCRGGCLDGEVCNSAGFCQLSTCEGFTACPAGALCDVVTSACIPNTTCTRNEHCPFGQVCGCTGNTCQ
jgi:hypothetical protein